MESKSNSYGECSLSLSALRVKQLVVSYAIHSNFIQDMRAALPYEGGGVLLGRVHHGSSPVDTTFFAHRFFVLPNTLQSSTRFLADPIQTVAAVLGSSHVGETIIATVHSHPNADAFPSIRDVQEAFDYTIAHVIVGTVTSKITTNAFFYRRNPLGYSFHAIPLVFSNPIGK